MEKALFLYSRHTGGRRLDRAIAKLNRALSSFIPGLESREIFSIDEAKRWILEEGESYEAILILGGDGTLHHLVNALAMLEHPPILGYFNAGTVGDFGKDYGITHSLRKDIRIIKKGYHCAFDLMQINGVYASYHISAGAYTDISYKTKRDAKKHLGPFAYYFAAVHEAFVPHEISLRLDGKPYHVPFAFITNGKRAGGFIVNSHSKTDDGIVEAFFPTPGAFNGLLRFLFRTKKGLAIKADSSFSLETDGPVDFDIDGEHYQMESPQIVVCPKKLRIFCAKKYQN